MPVKKLLLRTDKGEVSGVVTLYTGMRNEAIFPEGFTPLCARADGKTISIERQDCLPIPRQATDLSLLGTYRGQRVFATTLTGKMATFEKYCLCSSLTEDKQPCPPLNPPLDPLEKEATIPPPQEESIPPLEETGTTTTAMDQIADSPRQSTDLAERFSLSLSPEREEDPLSRARELLEQGKPFSLFSDLMPNSCWALIDCEECPYLIGIVKDDQKERVLYGIMGSRAYPPDEERLWTFFPTTEEGEEGYYVTEYNDGNGE